MPSALDHHSSTLVKMLFIGDSGTGKTGALISLLQAGYKIGMLDTDNGIDVLINLAKHTCPDKVRDIKYVTVRDVKGINKMNQMKVIGQPRAFVDAMKFTEDWDDGTKPKDWGPEWVFVLDTLGTLGTAAVDWAESLNPSAKEPRTWVNVAQRALEAYVSGLTAEGFATNVIVISHLAPGPKEDLVQKLYASSVGRALGPHLPKYFNNLILAEQSGMGKNVKRVLRTVPTGVVDTKTSAPFAIDGELPQLTGLATIFSAIKGQKP